MLDYFDSAKVKAEYQDAQQKSKEAQRLKAMTLTKAQQVAEFLGLSLEDVLNTAWGAEYKA